MKKIITLLLLTCCIQSSQAQTFAEWFQQGKTQKKYLTEQIAALQFYIGIAKEGYKAAGKGLQTIGDIKNGDFNMGNLYFSSLKAVNPAIAAYPKAKDALLLQQATLGVISKSKRQASVSGAFSAGELSYIQSVYQRLAANCDQTVTELEAITSQGKLEMKDDERIERIDKLYLDTQNQYRFVMHFSEGLSVLAVQKSRNQREIEAISKQYNFK